MNGVTAGSDGRLRCPWAVGIDEYERYHDEEWGRPVTGENQLFERISLEAFQSGLSWLTILRKRDAFRRAFAGFDAEKVARFDAADVERLLQDAGIIRNRAKITATIANAKALLALHDQGKTLSGLLRSHGSETAGASDAAGGLDARGKPGGEVGRPGGSRTPGGSKAPVNHGDVPAITAQSRALAKELKNQGFRFVGPTTAYATMQATGIVNDHLAQCWVRNDV